MRVESVRSVRERRESLHLRESRESMEKRESLHLRESRVSIEREERDYSGVRVESVKSGASIDFPPSLLLRPQDIQIFAKVAAEFLKSQLDCHFV